METAKRKKTHRCTFDGCSSTFDRPYKLTQHLLSHNNIRPHACEHPNCTKAYSNRSHLLRHIYDIHLPQESNVVHSCPKCFVTFVNRQNLKRHLRTVHQKLYACDICKQQFKKKHQLGAHMFVHTGVDPFSCEVCPQTFKSNYLKMKHMKYHKAYNCEGCTLVFFQRAKYLEHKKAQHEKNEYICDDCGKHFKRRTHILRHLKIHTEEHINRTFPCPYDNCERYYSRNSNLKQHILVKHMNIFHVCYICNAQLSTKAKLNYHLQLHYNTAPPDEFTEKAPTPNDTERKTRKDQGTFKSSTALKLSGLTKPPDEPVSEPPSPLTVGVKVEMIEVDCDVVV